MSVRRVITEARSWTESEEGQEIVDDNHVCAVISHIAHHVDDIMAVSV